MWSAAAALFMPTLGVYVRPVGKSVEVWACSRMLALVICFEGSPWDVAFHLLGQTASDPIAFTAALATRGPWVYALELFENLRFLRLRVDAVLCHHVAAACRETGSRPAG